MAARFRLALGVVLAIGLSAVFASAADPPVREVKITESQNATFYMANGVTAAGKLLDLDGTTVNCVVKGKKYKYAANKFAAIELKDGLVVYVPARSAFVRLEPVRVVNDSGGRVTFTLNAATNYLGNDITLTDDRTKSNLETGLTSLAQALGGMSGSPPQKAQSVEWTLEPGQKIDLKYGTVPIRSNRITFTLKNEHGSTKQTRENANLGSEFVLTVAKTDVHSPVLVKLGEWKIDQDVTYSVVRGREPARSVTVPVESFDRKKIVRYETTYFEGRDYEYTKRENGGVATASAEIENPTAKPLKVEITLEFSFAHLLLSKAHVTTHLEVGPSSKGTVRMEVNTKGFFDNRNVTGVKVVDVTTTPK
jgi:hypothetical protein